MSLQSVVTSILLYACFAIAGICIYLVITFLKPYKRASTHSSFTDLIDYAYIDSDDVIVLKNGLFMRIFEIETVSSSNCDPDEGEVTRRLEQLLIARKNLKKNFMLNFDLISTTDDTEDDITYKGHINGYYLFKGRNEVLKHNSKKFTCYLSLTMLPEDNRVSLKYLDFANTDDSLRQNFLEKTESFAATLKDFNLRALTVKKDIFGKSHEAVNFLKYCICGRMQNIQFTKTHTPLDLVLSSDDFKISEPLKCGNRYIGVLALDTVPDESYAGILNRLTTLDFPFRFSSRFISFDEKTSRKNFNQYYRLWNQNKTSLLSQFLNIENSRTSVNAQEQIKEVEHSKGLFDNNKLELCSYCANVIFFAKTTDEIEKRAREIGATLMQNGINTSFGYRLETINACEAYLGSLPGHYLENLRRAIIPDTVFADFIPMIESYKGSKLTTNPLFKKDEACLMTVLADSNTRAYLNLHSDGLGNTLVAGPSGSGKSVLLGAMIVSLLRYEGMQIFAFDKGYSFYALTKAFAGAHFTLDENSDLKLCPLEYLESEDDIDRAMEFLEILFSINSYELHPNEKKILRNSLYELREYKGASRSLSLYMSLVCNDRLNEVISKYANESSILNGEHNFRINSALTVFECGLFFNKSPKTVYPSLSTIFNIIDRQMVKSRCSAIIIDEAWLMMQDPVFAKKMIAWIKTVRKNNSLLIMATQSLNDFVRTGLIDDLRDNVKHRIFLPNADAKNSKSLYRELSLTDSQIECISKSTPLRDYLSSTRNGFLKFHLPLSSQEIKLLSRTIKHKADTDRLYEKYQEDFIWQQDF